MATVLVLTGAGVSADSGVATFRDAGGLWEGHRVEQVATPEAWAADPELVWRFYQGRRASLAGVEPNDAHRALARLEVALGETGHGFALITQNVDDLHERAGSKPIHMHGELRRLRCEVCDWSGVAMESLDPERYTSCTACGFERLRPDVVWFGELPRFMDEIHVELTRCTHFLAIGTSGVVYPAAGFLTMAREFGATTFVNSLDEPDNLSSADVYRPGRAAEVVPALVDELLAALSQ